MIGSACTPAGHEKGAAAAGGAGPGLGTSAALMLVWRSVISVGFALPRDADLRSAFPGVRAALPGGVRADPAPLRNWEVRRLAPLRGAVPV